MDFQKAEKAFKEYLKNYNINDGSIALKIRHTYEVVRKSEYIATGLGLDKENIELAKVISMLPISSTLLLFLLSSNEYICEKHLLLVLFL